MDSEVHPAAAGLDQGTHSATPWSSVISTMGTGVSFSSDPHDSGADFACRSECLVPEVLIAVHNLQPLARRSNADSYMDQIAKPG